MPGFIRCIVSVPLLLATGAMAEHYSLRKVEPLPGRSHDQTSANAVDDAGNAVGTSSSAANSSVSIGIVRLASGTRVPMGSLADCFPYGGSGLSDVSPAGHFAGGTSSVCGGFSRAATGAVTNPGGYSTFAPLPGGGDCAAYGANDNSVVGWSNLTIGCSAPLCTQTTARPMKWDAGGAVQLPLSPFVVAIAIGINSSGVIVGEGFTALSYDATVAVRWDTDTSLPVTLPAVNGAIGLALRISDGGTVVGQSQAGASLHATRWTGLAPHDLGTLPGDSISIAYDIDDRRGIVGLSRRTPEAQSVAVLWRGGQMIDLNSRLTDAGGVVLTSANGINRNGWIAANGIYEGKSIGFVLVPCFADLNEDDVVDDTDFSIFVVAYNTLDCADPSMPAGCPADFNVDGVVDDADFVIFVPAYDALLCP